MFGRNLINSSEEKGNLVVYDYPDQERKPKQVILRIHLFVLAVDKFLMTSIQ
jgi:hypothetical protein